MASVKTKFAVGLFVLAGFVVIVVALVWLGMSHYFEKGSYYAAYFDQSVQGLDRDSAVKYRGVAIGRVDQLGVAPDNTLIEVILKIESDLKLEQDMVAELKSVGITGIMFIELERKAPDDVDRSPKFEFSPPYPVVATKPSVINRVVEGIDDVLVQIEAFDLKLLFDRIQNALAKIDALFEGADFSEVFATANRTLDQINQTVADARIKQLSDDLRATIAKMDRVLGDPKWNTVLASIANAGTSFSKLSAKAETTVGGANRVLDTINQTLREVRVLLSSNKRGVGPMVAQFRNTAKSADDFFQKGTELISGGNDRLENVQDLLIVTLEQLERVSANLNGLIEALSDQPSRLLFSAPPPQRNIEPEK